MDEELKKEIEELKKEEEKKKEEDSEEEKTQEDLSEESKKEPTKKVEEEDLKESRIKKRFESLNLYLKIFGIVFAFLGIVAGIFVLNKLLSQLEPNLVKKQLEQTEEIEPSLKKKEIKVYTEKKGSSVVKPTYKGKEENKKGYYYTVTIFPLIMPISEKSFLKAEVTLFYSTYQEIMLCRKNIFWYKEFFYNFLQKVPSDVWLDRNKLEKISEEAIKNLKRANIIPIPVKIKIDGAILKA